MAVRHAAAAWSGTREPIPDRMGELSAGAGHESLDDYVYKDVGHSGALPTASSGNRRNQLFAISV